MITKHKRGTKWAIASLLTISSSLLTANAQNPYLPLGEFIPDGEPYVFDDPDCPGKKRVYIYGSHDVIKTAYCGKDQVVWSASTDDLLHWRYDGVILDVRKGADGSQLHEDGQGDVLFAPDIAVKKGADGKPVYYLYPNNQCGGRQGMIAKSNRPDGPFEVCNWTEGKPQETYGILRFDPGVFVDDDGRAYGYWGFNEPNAAELDTTTMCTVKPGTEIAKNFIPGRNQDDLYRFFEASSIRKIKDKYVFIYSRWTKAGDFGMPETNYTLAYCYSNNPLGPYKYGGTIIDGRGREPFDSPLKEVALGQPPTPNTQHPTSNTQHPTSNTQPPTPNPQYTATPTGNTHGSICEINGQWYVFYHRQSGTTEYHRQAMVAPITVDVKEGPDGYVKISEGEYNSCGFQLDGLDPYQKYPAAIACYYTGPEGAHQEYPNVIYSGSHPECVYADYSKLDYSKQRGSYTEQPDAPYADELNQGFMVNNTAGSVIGYKYFNLNKTNGKKKLSLLLGYTPESVAGTIDIYVDRPTTAEGGKKIATVKIKANPVDAVTSASSNTQHPTPNTQLTAKADVSSLTSLTGKHALFLVFSSKEKGKSICQINTIQFK